MGTDRLPMLHRKKYTQRGESYDKQGGSAMKTYKRAAAAMLSAVMSFCLFTSGLSAGADTALTDLNGDGVIDVYDYVLAKRGTVAANSPLTLTVSSADAVPGQTVTFRVGLEDNPGVSGMHLLFEYSPGLIPLSEEESGGKTAVSEEQFTGMDSSLKIDRAKNTLLYATNAMGICDDNGALFSAAFRVPANAVPGTSYTLTLRRYNIYGQDDESLSMVTARGRVNVLMPSEEEFTTKHGVDVSMWQGDIDFTELAKHADFVVMRAGFGRYAKQVDKRFYEYYDNAKAAGMPVGIYWYSYALSPEEARIEAQVCLEVLGDRKLEYPIAFDLEEPSQIKLGKEMISEIICAFCDEIESAGYYATSYACASMLRYQISDTVKDRYDIWVAHYNVEEPAYNGSYGMWQYSATGQVPGVSTNVDLNYSYRDYPSIIQYAGLNGY